MFLVFLLKEFRNEARQLLSRIPNPLYTSSAYANILALVRAFYSRSYHSIFNVLGDSGWPTAVLPLKARFRDHFAQQTLGLISQAYTTISLSTVALYLGLPTESTETMTTKLVGLGWEFEETNQLLKPAIQLARSKELVGNIRDERIDRLSSLVTHLTEI